MDCLLAKIKRQRSEPYRKITSDNSVFEEIDITTIDCVLYDPDHKLDEGSWFKIEDFNLTVFSLDILSKCFDSKDYNNIKKGEFANISYLISVQNGDFYFQNVTTSSYIKLKTIIFGEAAKITESDKQIIIKKTPDAVYCLASKILLFRDLSAITSIFPNIGILYKEATQAEVESFLKEPFIKKGNDYDSKNISVLNRKLITAAIEALSQLTPEDKEDMFVYVNDYCADEIVFDLNSKEFEINCDNDLKTLLYGIQERFYTTRFGQEKRLANSIKVL